jgi:exonuclease VII large subunit
VRRLLIHVYSLIDTLDSYFESAKIEGGEEENAQSKQLQNQLEDQLNQLDFYKEKILDRIKQIVDEKQPDSNKYVLQNYLDIFHSFFRDCSMPSHMQEHLPERKSIDDSLANQWLEIQSLYQGRLWHELTIRVKSFVRQDELQHDDRLKNFYENFLSNFEQHINQLELVEIIIPISRTFKQVEEAVQFIQQIREKVKNHSLAVLLCDITIGKAYLVTKNLIETKKIIEDLTPKFDELDHLTTVHSRFYDLASNYYRVMGNHCDYYQSTLKYFGK